MTAGDIVTLVGVLVTLAVAVVAYVQSRRNKGDDIKLAHETAAANQAQQVIQMALEEKGLASQVSNLQIELAATARQLHERIDKESAARQRIERTMLRTREENLTRFVTRDDWLSAQARTDRKLDGIGAELHKLSISLHERTNKSE